MVPYGVEGTVKEIKSEVSFTARAFFEKHGYQVERIQKRKANKLKLTNFVMYKTLN